MSDSMTSEQRAMGQQRVQKALQSAGYTNISILDTSYLISATTPDGDPVLMILNPPAMAGSMSGDSTGMSGTSGSGASGTSGKSGSSTGSSSSGSSTKGGSSSGGSSSSGG
ncbi:hypothetical protein [Consotaella salsifontis]|nr:hypothetical protein [Consotaella salsifontis]